MYVHLGKQVLVKSKDIIGIFDIEKTTTQKTTRDFLSSLTKKHTVITVSYKMPKTFVVCTDKKNHTTVYISQISADTLKKRASIGKSYFKLK